MTADGILGWDLSSGDARTIADEPEGAFLRAGHTAGAFVRYARGKLAVIRVDSTPEVDLARCPGSGAALRSAYLPDGTPIAACAGRDAFPNTVSSLADPARIWLRMDGQGGPPSALAVGPKGHRVAVGTEAGLVVVVDGDGDEVLRRQTDLPGIHALALSEHRVAIAGTRGGVEVVALDRGALVASLPAGPAEVAWLDEDHLRVADGRIRDWRVPSMAWPHRLEMGAGVADVAVSADGRWIGSVQGNGTLVVVDRHDGVPLLSRTLPEGVAKAVAFEPGGGRVAAGTALGGEVVIFDVASGHEVLTLPTWRTRRLAWVGDSLFVAPYMFVLRSFTGVGATKSAPVPRSWPVETQVDDMEVTAGGRSLSVLEDRGRVWRIDPRKEPGPEPSITVPAGVAIAGTDVTTFVATPRQIVVLDRALNERARFPLDGAEVLELAVSEDGRWLATGHRDGTVGLYAADGGQQRAVFQGHRGRVVGLTFVPDGSALVSGSWDGTVRTWGLDVLEAPAEDLVGPITRAWGMGLDEALGR